ncbi:MAG: hypothetical protein JSV05_03510 [Candidatus Bathyarchaeota archaeon]|nr:MAG: hypothetical protein JSV05_03510 [Candidatus Bathyarchaeota archaeon]
MSDTLQMKIPEKVLAMNMSSILELLQKYPIVTRKLLLIRPLRPNRPDEVAINKVADAFVVKANDAGWEVKDLKGNAATKTNIVNTINNWNPDFVVYYGHSLNSYIPGQQNNQLQFAITPSNVSLLSNKTASITACHTVSTIGVPAVKAGAVCYLGYKVPFTGVWGSLLDHDFEEATNAANIALLNGEKYSVAKDKGSKRWKKFYDDLVIYMKNNPNDIRVKKMDPTIPGGLLDNANGLDYVGNPNAVARPIGILLTTP